VRTVHESNTAENVMPGRLVTGPWILNPGTGVRIAPLQPRGGVAKKARRLPAKEIIGVRFSPPPPDFLKKFCAGVAQWEERGPRKPVIGVRIAALAPLV
jgi:hypothetical protein